ncbi:hypothetical protein [Sandaracinobacteroides hominis]|uniref:hypothetical protein n=1 Tax=Sandaracinobacteroides hominis TaxID=2780086 RepID=UPI0018F5DA58|nr:hypothetical protein [Sandaracinobacteroides hominis]
MDFWEAVVLIVAIVVIGRVMSGGRWNKETRRWEKNSPDNPYARMGGIANDEVPILRKEIARLNDRVATLEKIAVDPSRQLSDEIERLRAIPKAARPDEQRPHV